MAIASNLFPTPRFGVQPDGTRWVTYHTGRVYGGPQALSIKVPPQSFTDDYDMVFAYFSDEAREIKGRVRVFAIDIDDPRKLAEMVLYLYDTGNYE